MSREVIAISGKAGSGKTTTAKVLLTYLEDLVRLRVDIIPFAKAVKEVAHTIWGNPSSDSYFNKNKLRGKYIAVGNGMRQYDPDCWVNKVLRDFESKPDLDVLIIDDLRFRNELKVLLQAYGINLTHIRLHAPDQAKEARMGSAAWQEYQAKFASDISETDLDFLDQAIVPPGLRTTTTRVVNDGNQDKLAKAIITAYTDAYALKFKSNTEPLEYKEAVMKSIGELDAP